MIKRTLFLTILIAIGTLGKLCAQNEILLLSDKAYLASDLFLFSLKPKGDNKILVKYLSFPNVCVKSDDESTMNGRVMATNGAMINGYVRLADKAMVLTEQEIDLNTKSSNILSNNLIALRSVNEAKSYKLYFENSDHKYTHLKTGMAVPYNRFNYKTISGITSEEKEYIELIYNRLYDKESNESVSSGFISGSKELQGFKALMNDVNTLQQTFKLPTENENTLKYDVLDEGVEYLITRDRRIKKDEGVAYKTYFVYDKKKLVKADSCFFADKSDLERPDRVYDIESNNYSGILTRLSCEPLNADKKNTLTYFRYAYIDKNKPAKRYRFQLENGKLNSFAAERTFKLGDTLIHLTTKKTGFLKVDYQSSIFSNDTVNLRYPIKSEGTLSFKVLYCGKGVGASGFFGTEKKICMNTKVGDRYFILEQETMSKSSAGYVKMDHPEANIKGFALTKIYELYNNSVRNIYKISVPYFSDRTVTYSSIYESNDKKVYMLKMEYPVLFTFNASGEMKLREANQDGYTPTTVAVGNKYTFEMNKQLYMVYLDKSTGKTKLIPLQL